MTASAGVPDARTSPSGRDGLEYHQLFRAGRQPVAAWSLLGALAVAVLFLVVNVVVVVSVFTVWFAATGTPADEVTDKVARLADTDPVTPGVLLFVNLVIVLAIPGTWLCVRAFQGLAPRWLTSVRPRVRWRWLAASFGVSLFALVLTIVLGSLLPASGDTGTVSGELNDFTATSRDFLLVIVLLTPLQAIAEEYVFRGYLTQAFGGLVADLRVSRAVAVLAPAVLFALAHGTQDFPVFVDRLAFGISAGILVIATGGLEAGIAYHVVNNLLAFGITLAVGDMTTVLTPEGGSWWDVALTVLKSVIFVGLSIWVARRMGVQTRVSREGLAELARPGARV
ncbi:CPBP family intramembrane glutamic endopeptidase [Nocardioides dongxiaopingii]|uniref:CPBP family intramembrane glutamic endopeptidase n=1 Tax=Nocardioides sp. S-1144 TaxID=2582905 RepID=UPI0021CB1642|nr:CPBP family intramembrane glutamic endopeptidase [Nocardioides sp. S-1144]